MKAFIRSKNEEIQTPGYPVQNCTQTSQVYNSMHDNALGRIRYALDHPELERGGWQREDAAVDYSSRLHTSGGTCLIGSTL